MSARPRLEAALASIATIVLVLGAGGLAWFSAGQRPAPVAAAPGDTPEACGMLVGIVGDLSSPWITPYLDGASLRFKQDAGEHPDCALSLAPYDTHDSSDDAVAAAKALVVEPSVLGVIGGIYSAETVTLLPAMQEAGIAMVSPGATRTNLSDYTGPRVFHRIVASDHQQGVALGDYLRVTLADDVIIVEDGTPYGTDVADGLIEGLADQVPWDRVVNGPGQFETVVAQVAAAGPSHVFYAGTLGLAPTLLGALRTAGVDAQFLGPESVFSARLPRDDVSLGTIATCSCAPAPEWFVADYLRAYGREPEPGAAEGYDAASIFIDVIRGGANTRAEVLAGVDAYDRDGLTKHLRFDEYGDLASPVVWSYRITPTGVEPLLPLRLGA